MRLLLIFFLLCSYLQSAPLKINVTGEAAILMNAKTGKILYEKNADRSAFPASTTKIATALMALHLARDQLDKVFTADREALASITPQAKKQSNYRSPAHWLETDSTHIGIKRGEEFTLNNLLHAILIASANDASNVVALGLGETIPKFMDQTNAYLKKIGCKNTYFNNPSGLHHPSHVTTAYDLAIMAKEGLKDPIFSKIVSTVRYTCPQTNLEFERMLNQTNHLLKNGPHYYPRAIGIKTGTTQAAGKNLVAAAQEGERVLIAVALGYRGLRAELYQDVTALFEAAFNEPKMRRTLLFKGLQNIETKVRGGKTRLKTELAENLSYEFYPSEEVPIKVSFSWEIPPLPIKPGQTVGTIRVIGEEGELINQLPLLAWEEVKATAFYKLTHLFTKKGSLGNKRTIFIYFGGLIFIWLFLWRMRRRGGARRYR